MQKPIDFHNKKTIIHFEAHTHAPRKSHSTETQSQADTGQYPRGNVMLYCMLQMFWNIVGANEARRDAKYEIVTVRSKNANLQADALSAA